MTVSYPVGATSQFSPPVQFVDDSGLPVDLVTDLGFGLFSHELNGVTIYWAGTSGARGEFVLLVHLDPTDSWIDGGYAELDEAKGIARLALPNAIFSAANVVKLWCEQTDLRLIAESIQVGAEALLDALEDVAPIAITTAGPVINEGDPLVIVQGDSYVGRPITINITATGAHGWTSDAWSLWFNTAGADPLEAPKVSATSPGSNQLTLTFEPTDVQTATLIATVGFYGLKRTPAGGSIGEHTSQRGKLTVQPSAETRRDT